MANKANLKTLLAISVFLLVVVFGGAGQTQAAVIADAVAEFSGTQGQNNWYYGYYVSPYTSATFQEMDQFDGWGWYDQVLGSEYPVLWDVGGIPGFNEWVVRRWVSDVSGKVTITGKLAKWPYADDCGDGIAGHILVDGVEVWAQYIEWDNTVGVHYSITVSLDGGSIVDFAIDPYGTTNWCDQTTFTATIALEPATARATIYVDATKNGDGTSWANAYNYLQDALAVASWGDEIWVADGTYYPDANTADPGSGDPNATFQLISCVTLKGGYAGYGAPDPNARDIQRYETILSGDLLDNDNPATPIEDLVYDPCRADNSYHVVTGSGTDANAVLDGFTITKGNANGSQPDNWGGGMFTDTGSSTIVNCTFTGNSASSYGGGMINYDYSSPKVINCSFSYNIGRYGGGVFNFIHSDPMLTNCTFIGNSTDEFGVGGALSNMDSSSPTVSNCTFTGNSTSYNGGGMANFSNCDAMLTNCTFIGNSAERYGGGIYNRNSNDLTLINCILWGNSAGIDGNEIGLRFSSIIDVNYCDIQGGEAGVYVESGCTLNWGQGNIDADPLFVDANGLDGIIGTEDDNLRLCYGSPCIDAGDNDAVPSGVTTDLDGKWRFFDDPYTTDTGNGTAPIVDMGAYERQQTINYDLVKSGYVDWKDLEAFTDEWLNDCNLANNWCDGADFDQSGDVGFGDFGLWAEYWLSDFLGDLDNLLWADVMSQEWQQPAKLDDFIGVHPRYLLTAAKVTDLKSKIASAGVHQDIWLNVVKPKADWYLTESPYGGHNEDVMRPSGRAIPWLALAYLMTDNTTYSDKAISWMLTVCGYSNWDNNYSLGAGEGLVGVSIGYDWLYDDLTEPNRVLIRDKLIYQAGEMAADPVHKERWLANHNHVEHNGLAAAGFVLYDDGNAPDANDWIRQADLVFQTAFVAGSSDGSSTEGHQYWGYSMESILCYTEAARDLMGKDYYDSKWIEGATDFIIFCTLPDFNTIPGEPGYANCVMSFGDSHRDYRGHGPTHILCRLASEYNNGFAQWLAEEMIDRGVGVTQEFDYRAWANLLWYDETVTPAALSGLGTFKHFEDIGWVTSRSGWDEDAVMVSFKCGPFHGHKVQPYYEKQVDENWPETKDPNMEDLYGFKYHKIVGGHGQPDVGSFQVYAHGKWLATEPGYSNRTASRMKHTKDHCTILAGFGDPNERGQVGEWTEELNSSWFDVIAAIDAKATSSIIKAESCAEYDYIIGDAENIYRDPNLSKFLRHFIYIKPDVIVIADELEDASPPSADYFQWRLRAKHARPDFEDNVNIVVVQDPNYYRIENQDDLADIVVMDVHFVHPELSNFSTSIETVTEYYGNESKFLVADFDSTSGGDLLATVLHPRRDEDPACSITSSSYVSSVLYLTISIGAETINVELDLANQEVNIE